MHLTQHNGHWCPWTRKSWEVGHCVRLSGAIFSPSTISQCLTRPALPPHSNILLTASWSRQPPRDLGDTLPCKPCICRKKTQESLPVLYFATLLVENRQIESDISAKQMPHSIQGPGKHQSGVIRKPKLWVSEPIPRTTFAANLHREEIRLLSYACCTGPLCEHKASVAYTCDSVILRRRNDDA